jgi:hypothetical protein
MTAQVPATMGVAMLVPDRYMYLGSSDTPVRLTEDKDFLFWDRIDRIAVPGATTSGLSRFSAVGPQLLNAANTLGLLAIWSSLSGFSGNR